MAAPILTQDYLKSILHYDPETGVFTRLAGSHKNAKLGACTSVDGNGYLRSCILGRKQLLHRLAFLYITGHFPSDLCDHINGIKTDNRWCNLREVNRQNNGRNSKRSKINASGVTGVAWDKNNRRWVARIHVSMSDVHLGRFHSFWDAICARKAAEIKYQFHPNHGRAA